MACRFLENPRTSSQKRTHFHSSPRPRKCSTCPRSLSSLPTQNLPSLPHTQRSCSPTRHSFDMTISVTLALRKWLTDHGLQGFIQVVEAPPHPNALEMANKLNINTLTDSVVCKNLGLSNTGEREFDILPTELLERYYGKYSQSAKAFRTRDIPDTFFRDIAEFLLEVGCTHINAYGMPK